MHACSWELVAQEQAAINQKQAVVNQKQAATNREQASAQGTTVPQTRPNLKISVVIFETP